ncbi:MAG: IS66 family transposase [Marmoricola sp.]|nr:IS66 family transposase [Marmoricola sp.]
MTESLPPEDPRDALIDELTAQVSELTALIAELREQLDAARRAASRNSGNSSLPPSGDDQPGRQPRRERRAAERAEKKRSRGKQPGSPGAAMRWREPDDTLDHFPAGACACGLDLAGAADLGVARSYQQEDVPEPRPSRRYQHNLHKAKCACGKVHMAERPDGVPDVPLSVGPRLSAMAVYLSVFQHLPVERAQQLIGDLTGGIVSAGFVHSCLAKAAGLVRNPVALIRTLIAASPVAGFDETTLRSGPAGEKKYVHGAFTELYSAFHLGTRSIESMKKGGILPFFAGIVVSDRYQGYWSETWTAFAGHQACAAHLIRDFEDCAETYPGSGWPQQAQRALRGLIHAWHAAREQGLPAVPGEVREPLELEFRRAVTFGLSAVPRVPGPKTTVKQKPGREMLEFCKAREADVLRFASDTSVWPTNNISERGVRPLKTQQKISGRLTSDDVTQDRLDIRGYIDTARKHGLGALEVLEQLMLGRPWMPPAQPISP